MGYTTEFTGVLTLNEQLDRDTEQLLRGLASTRRMKRNIEGYGTEGELFVDGGGLMGQEADSTVIDYNHPPITQPGLWCDFEPTEDAKGIEWNGSEKTYDATDWIQYICTTILEPRGYVLNGTLQAQGEEADDIWELVVTDNRAEAI